jgi:hypothetical protein
LGGFDFLITFDTDPQELILGDMFKSQFLGRTCSTNHFTTVATMMSSLQQIEGIMTDLAIFGSGVGPPHSRELLSLDILTAICCTNRTGKRCHPFTPHLRSISDNNEGLGRGEHDKGIGLRVHLNTTTLNWKYIVNLISLFIRRYFGINKIFIKEEELIDLETISIALTQRTLQQQLLTSTLVTTLE